MTMNSLERVAVVVASAATPAAAGAFSDEHVAFTAMLVATVGVVAGLIAWIDTRIKSAVRDHEVKELALAEMRHSSLLAEIRHLRRELRLPEDREITDPARSLG